VVAPVCVDYGSVVLTPMSSFELCTDRISGFMESDKLSSFCNYFIESYLPTSRWLVRGRMR
jgi:hypothetical protein